ncbi:MAG: hypothetical protein DRP64_03675 [Verrucomicrobia bacterium]|nr:MAG: hypothetical protein DRP64_03675 [Verrucomicrobiota bacterium]
MPVPVLDVQMGVAKWLESHSDLAGTNETYDALTTLGISNVAVSVLVDDGKIAVFAKVDTDLSDARETWLSQTNLIQLESVSENEFKWVPAQKKNSPSEFIPTDSVWVRFSGSTVLVADKEHFSAADALESGMAESGLLQTSIRLAPLLDPLFVAAEKMIDAQEEGFGKAMMAGMLTSLKTSTEAIQDVPGVSLNIMAVGPDMRKMVLTLEYNRADTAADTKAFFDDSADAWKNPEISKKQLGLAGLVDTPFFQKMNLDGNQLQFIYEWPAAEDAALLEIVGKAALGNLFSFGDPNAFPLHPEETVDAPNLGDVAEFDAIGFEKEFRASLFFNHSWDTHVDLVVDCLDIPNVDLLSATLTNVCVLGTNGVNITHQKRQGGFGFNSATRSASISLQVEKDGPKPKTTAFTIEFKVPTAVEKYTLTKKNPLMESGDTGCCLIAMSNSVISLRSKGLSLREAKVYALNTEGKYLKRGGASWSESNYRGEYKGTPARVEVVFPVKTESVSIDFKNMAVEKKDKIEMPSSPTNSVVTRYTMEPLKTYSDPDMEAIAASSMAYVTNAGWKKTGCQLQFPKQDGVKTDTTSMKSYLTGVDELVGRGKRSGFSSSGDHFYWELNQTNTLNSATAIFGEFGGTFWSGIGTYAANVSTNPVPLIPGHELPAVSVEHNVVWVEKDPEGKVLDAQAFHSNGRRLKKDNRTSRKNSKTGYFFWGNPSRVSVVYASSKESVVVPFEIELKEGGLGAIPAAREKIQAFDETLALVKEIKRKTHRHYGNLLSASYYACNSNKEPIARIPPEVAQSDPIGAAVFGYELKPFKGYYFRKILTDRDAKKESKKSSHAWAGGEFEATSDSGLLLATPVDEKNPAILLRWNDVYVNYRDCSKLETIPSKPSDLAAAGWIKVE